MKVPIRVTPGFYVYLSLCMLFLPLPWMAALLLAAAFHELGHIIALYLLKLPVCALTLSPGGARIQTIELTPKQEILVAAAGPLAGASLLLLFPWIPKVSLCALIQTLFNLLPLKFFDGGRILRCSMREFPG